MRLVVLLLLLRVASFLWLLIWLQRYKFPLNAVAFRRENACRGLPFPALSRRCIPCMCVVCAHCACPGHCSGSARGLAMAHPAPQMFTKARLWRGLRRFAAPDGVPASRRGPFCASRRPVSPRRSACACKWLCARGLRRRCAAAAQGAKNRYTAGRAVCLPRRPAARPWRAWLGGGQPRSLRLRQIVAKRGAAVQ